MTNRERYYKNIDEAWESFNNGEITHDTLDLLLDDNDREFEECDCIPEMCEYK